MREYHIIECNELAKVVCNGCGKELRVELKAYLRKEQKFNSQEELFLQIKKDGEQSLARLEMLL